ncbi:DUF1642 domain-containing protein [Lactococcus lactis]|uniref:DUF1642 domain-containing protein n=1 Tax=Lactococcus lactis TaxID=1358 RepID=A0AAW7IWN4_9LACT|nr:DUF1642 domain-containing protein [Lactococcus lactis]MDM7547325.1 DUF1642 domain-containing protein [Lactococcus lactis]
MDKTLKQKLEMLPIKNIEHPVGDTKYYAAVHVKSLIAQADEEFQELLSKYSGLNDNYEKEVIRSSKLESQIIGLKSQLQQQALPVVPECVGSWIECVKGKNKNALALLDDDNMPDDVNEWLFFQRNDDNINLILRAWLDGYTVEKPQLFYLKNKLTRHYLYHRDKVSFGEQDYCKDRDDKPLDYCLFTQQEIDSMETGSYEQIPVPVEDGE